jgi:deoxyadenosine/deoxycytidine kinase
MDNGEDTFRAILSQLKGKIIVIEGSICAGKTTLCRKLYDCLVDNGFVALLLSEQLDNTLFKQFLDNQKKYAGPFQLDMLAKREKKFQDACVFLNNNPGGCVIMDRGLPGDHIFMSLQCTKGNICGEWFLAYQANYWRILMAQPRALMYVLYLKTSPEISYTRYLRRCEEETAESWNKYKRYDKEYFKELAGMHDRWFLDAPNVAVMHSSHVDGGNLPDSVVMEAMKMLIE